MGMKGMRCTKIEDLTGSIKELLAFDGPVLLEVVVDVSGSGWWKSWDVC